MYLKSTYFYARTYQYKFDVFRAWKATHAGIAIETSQTSQNWLVWLGLFGLFGLFGLWYWYGTGTACCHLRRRRADCRSIVRTYAHRILALLVNTLGNTTQTFSIVDDVRWTILQISSCTVKSVHFLILSFPI
jgi:hypothetical protein